MFTKVRTLRVTGLPVLPDRTFGVTGANAMMWDSRLTVDYLAYCTRKLKHNYFSFYFLTLGVSTGASRSYKKGLIWNTSNLKLRDEC